MGVRISAKCNDGQLLSSENPPTSLILCRLYVGGLDQWRIHAGAIAPLPRGSEKYFRMQVKINPATRSYFLHYGIHGDASDSTQNALIPQLLGDLPPDPQQGLFPPAHPLGRTASRPLLCPPARTSRSASDLDAGTGGTKIREHAGMTY